MEEPEKPFACTLPDCGMTFTNEDHLHVHTKKHDMVLQFGLEQKTAFVADQTPTPTRFIRNCEEVGLFQDLQNVNPFDEGFKRAMETKPGLCLDGSALSDDTLHTPHFPIIDPGDTLYSTTNNQKNITISRSSSDETGAIKEYETTTISKLTNEVTTISRVVGKTDTQDKVAEDKQTDKCDIVNETISYTNNVIIHSNVGIRKEEPPVKIIYKNVTENTDDKESTDKTNIDSDYEVTIKLPNGKHVKMKPVEESDAKSKLKKVLTDKEKVQLPVNPIIQSVLPITPTIGTLIPVTLLDVPKINKVPIPVNTVNKPVKRKTVEKSKDEKNARRDLESRSAASKRYRAKLKETAKRKTETIRGLTEANQRLIREKALLQKLITEHLKKCTMPDDLRKLKEELPN